MGKSTISMAIFNCKLLVHQRGCLLCSNTHESMWPPNKIPGIPGGDREFSGAHPMVNSGYIMLVNGG